MSVLADHRVDPGDDAPPTVVSRAPSASPVSAPHDDVLAEPADPEYADGEYEGTDYEGAEYDDAGYDDPGYATPASAPLRPEELRADFGAHFEGHYQRLVAQLYAITLNPAEAHDVVREAYSRAWRKWAEIGASADPAAWVRRVAVRSTMRSWRRAVARLVPGRRAGPWPTAASRAPAPCSSPWAGCTTRNGAPSSSSTWPVCPSSRSRCWSGCPPGRSPPACRAPAAWSVTRSPRQAPCVPASALGPSRTVLTVMTDTHWVSQELRELDDELAAAVELPPVDTVIRQAGRTARASTAAAAAVLTVGALGGVTALTHVGDPASVEDAAPVSVEAAAPPSASTTSTTSTIPTTESAVAPAVPTATTTRPRPRPTTAVRRRPVAPARCCRPPPPRRRRPRPA